MTQYARIQSGVIAEYRDLDPAKLALLSPAKQAMWLPVVVDAQPTPSASQVLNAGPVVVEATQVRRTWTLRAKTQAELDAEELATESAQIAAGIAALNTQLAITDAAVDLMTAAQVRTLVRDDRRIVLKAVKWLARRALL